MDAYDAAGTGFFNIGVLKYAYGKGGWMGLSCKNAYGCLRARMWVC